MGKAATRPPVEVAFQNGGRYPELDSATLERWLEELVSELAPAAESVTVRLSAERPMRAMNRDFRGHDQVTDVLSFPGDAETEPGHLGDIVICVAQARRQAGRGARRGVVGGAGVASPEARDASLALEMKTLLLHGVLHCMGHDHETDDGEMERLERRLRRRWVRHD